MEIKHKISTLEFSRLQNLEIFTFIAIKIHASLPNPRKKFWKKILTSQGAIKTGATCLNFVSLAHCKGTYALKSITFSRITFVFIALKLLVHG